MFGYGKRVDNEFFFMISDVDLEDIDIGFSMVMLCWWLKNKDMFKVKYCMVIVDVCELGLFKMVGLFKFVWGKIE